MADKDSMSVEEILALCRRLDGGEEAAAAPPPSAPPAESEPAAAPAAKSEAAAPSAAAPGKSAKEMSVADVLAAARSEKAGGAAKPAAKEAPASGATPAPAGGAPAKKSGEMSVADILAAARGQKAAPAAAEKSVPKPAPAAKAKPAASPAKEAPKKPAAGPKTAVALDTTSILAAARKTDKRGPMTKEEAKSKAAVAEKPARPVKQKLPVPPMPEKPAYARPVERRQAAPAQESRRSFFGSFAGVFFGSSLAVGFTTLTLTNLLWLLGLARFMFPNILTEPPTKFKVGFPDDYGPGQVETKYLSQFGVWIVRYLYEGQSQIYALKSVCTHLGCTPNWLDAEQKFKCPCHGSGFYKDGINFEGPAPRPLERYAISLADDGQLEVDKSQTFQEELGQWANPASFVPV